MLHHACNHDEVKSVMKASERIKQNTVAYIIKLKALIPMLAEFLAGEMTKQNSFHCINETMPQKLLTENKYEHTTMVK